MSGIEEGRLDKSKDEACLLLYERHEALCLFRRIKSITNKKVRHNKMNKMKAPQP